MTKLTWWQIFRLGLVQTALGSIVVLCTSTMNRVMVVELALPATLPGLLVGLHYAVQLGRPRFGYDSDQGDRRTPWIIGGIGVLGLGAFMAAIAIALSPEHPWLGVAMAMVAYLLIGAGVGSSGTSLLAMLASRVDPSRRAPAASMVWLMMIAGFVVTTAIVGQLLDPFTLDRLVLVTVAVAAFALFLTTVALRGIEPTELAPTPEVEVEAPRAPDSRPFREVFSEVWGEPKARAFTIFVFISMLAYSTQDLILEPFAGVVFGLSPAESTKLASVQHSGVFLGMLLVAFAAGGSKGPRFGSIRFWTIAGCITSAIALGAIALAGVVGADWPLRLTIFALGFCNGAFAVAAIGWMMSLAGTGRESREGIRMGLWGGAQAIAFALGGWAGTMGVDLIGLFTESATLPYSTVFVAEAVVFLLAAAIALRLERAPARQRATAGILVQAHGRSS
ncbi:MAG: BCD family MFS transporter [Deltaproteobacteria bacterium]|nr:BCD family MFS transporter [Deltaproteobacteria bacterium]